MGTLCWGNAPQSKISLPQSSLEKHQSHGTEQFRLVVFLPKTRMNYKQSKTRMNYMKNKIYSTGRAKPQSLKQHSMASSTGIWKRINVM